MISKQGAVNKIAGVMAGLFMLMLLTGCGSGRASFSASRKYAPDILQKDYQVYRSLLETHHPGLYWYTSKDSMDYFFNWGRQQLNDSLTEPQFRKILSYVTAKVNCGHTTVRPSKAWNKYSDTARLGKMFPLSMKLWGGNTPNDEMKMVVTANLNRRDSILRRGTEILSINGRSKELIVDSLFSFISTDGYNSTHKFQSLSNRGLFGSLYTNIFGISEKYQVEYRDSSGTTRQIIIPVYNPAADTVGRGTRTFRPSSQSQPTKKQQRELRKNSIRLLRMDTANHSAMMDLASFGKGYNLKKFFHQSFEALEKNGITHLIIDLRSNGGGSVTNSTLITRYIANHPFKIADSLYAVKKGSPWARYIQDHFWNKLFIKFFTKKRADGYYHFGYFERHAFKPKKNHHFDGQVYILTGGNSFSASTLFASALLKQDNVTIVGEETGGGAYGNSAWLIPDATLPETGIRFRLPLFRLVIDKNTPKNGKGVQPEVLALPTVDDIRKNADFKVIRTMELIRNHKEGVKKN